MDSVNNGLVNQFILALAVDPSQPATLYAGTLSGEIFKSANAGASWTNSSDGLAPPNVTSVAVLAVDPSNSATVYAGTASVPLTAGVFKSTDGGANWTQMVTGLTNYAVPALAIAPSNPSTLYAGTDGGVFKTTNGGGNWTSSTTGLAFQLVYALAVDPSNPATLYAGTFNDRVYTSTNGGAGWTFLGAGIFDATIQSLVVDASNPSTLYAGTNGRILKSTNRGISWSVSNPSAGVVYALAIDPSNSAIVYAATDSSGVFKTIDGGTTWSNSNTGLTNLGVPELAIDPANPATLYAAAGRVFKTTNAGASWVDSSVGITQSNVFALAIDPANQATVYAGTFTDGLTVGGGGVFKSVDGGASWTASNNGLTYPGCTIPYNVNVLAIDPSNPSTLYAGTWRRRL